MSSGKLIKIISIVLFIISVVASFFLCIITPFFLFLIPGSFLSCLLMYGFGELIENLSFTVRHLLYIREHLPRQADASIKQEDVEQTPDATLIDNDKQDTSSNDTSIIDEEQTSEIEDVPLNDLAIYNVKRNPSGNLYKVCPFCENTIVFTENDLQNTVLNCKYCHGKMRINIFDD